MKTIYKTLLSVLFFSLLSTNAQSILDKYEGIPIETSLDWWNIQDIPLSVDSMDSAGVDIVHISFDNQNKLTAYFDKNYSMDLLPITTPKLTTGVYNWIQYYTDAKYSVWEAEGTQINPTAKGNATLYRDQSKTEVDSTNQYIRLIDSTAGSPCLMSWGPYYLQDVEYETYENGESGHELIEYDAEFWLKLECIGQDNAAPTDTLFILQITQSTWQLECSDTVAEIAVTRADFSNLNSFIPLLIDNYTLENFDCPRSVNNIFPVQEHHFSTDYLLDGVAPGPRWIRERMEFKVIWKGNANYSLSYDKVIVYDERGIALVSDTTGLYAKKNVRDQVNSLLSYQNSVFGWLGIDEPQSIDQYEPIRVVDSLIRAKTQNQSALVVPIMGCYWDGTFSHPLDAGSMAMNKYEEMKLRIGDFNIIQNAYMFDTPCNYDNDTLDKCDDGDIRAININNAANDIYRHAYQYFPNFGASLQCGAVYNEQANQRNVARHEVLYSANLALMYGAKFLQLWRYFPSNDINSINSGGTYHGIVDWVYDADSNIIPIYTDKYFMLKDTLSPRMKGLMGKALKTLTPTEQILNAEYLIWHNYLSLLIHYSDADYGKEFDIGFFKDGLNRDYFMLANRWYNLTSAIVPVTFDPAYFDNYNNLQIYNLIDSTKMTIQSSQIIYPRIELGDALFYRVGPVVRYGGSLNTNEYTITGETLLEDLSIESGVTLTVNGNYYAKANINVKAGGKIISAENAKIIFDPGKKLIIEGSAEIKGTSTNRLVLEFNSLTNQGVVINAGASIDMQYCDIKYSQVGIAAEVGTEGIYVSYSSFTNCTSTGILMLGDTQHNEATPIVSNCTFTNCSTGISAANYSEILINQNTVSNSYLGITISSIPSAFIQGNVISGNSNSNNDGILIVNSGGYIRSNIVQNHVNGIRIGNSSPDIGGNILENNKSHGLYVGSGSIPNLVGHLQINPPLYFPLSGYNKIFNNGSGTLANTPGNDSQSEIYLSASNIALRDGCNEIQDDRTATPSMNTLLLMNGSLAPGGGRQLDARNNYWGTTTPTAARFGSLSVIFSPYYGEPCLVPDGGGGSGEEILVLKTSSGEIVDSISAAEGVPENLTTLEASYSEADNYFAKGSVDLAKPLYEQIVSSNYSAEEKLPAYNKLYTIGNLIGEDENYFNSLQTTFNDIANAETDTLLKKIYNQNAIKCDVSKEEYLTAISKFDNIIQQNPNSEEAIYAEIDIITTALNIDTTNSLLGKMGNGKYLVKGTADYLTKLNNLLRNKFGINTEEKEQIIPKEYSLYQNYPNPFNPTTTIKFDIPKDGLVQLEIFDILGRRIATLVEDYKTAGSYEQVFDASSLASGVYVYKLQAGEFVTSKKMILLK